MAGTIPRTDAGSPTVPFRQAVRAWAEVGLNSFGGPAGQIAVLHGVVVERHGWVSERRFLDALNFCMLLPGPEAQQLATYLGWILHGIRGGLVAGLLFILPGVVAIGALSVLFVAFGDAALVSGLFFGVKPVVIAIVISALVRIARRTLHGGPLVAVAAAAFVGIFFIAIPFPLIVLAAGLLGLAVGRLAPGRFAIDAGAPAVAGEDAVPQAPQFVRTLRMLAVGLSLWLGPVVALSVVFGPDNVLARLANFFSVAAVVTFGGAYAVLAFVAQQAVEVHGWLLPGEMVDGLAMAESTPGPLIMVVQYVGFLAGYRDPGVLPPLLMGLIAALVTIWVTFVPSFLWIFLGAPYADHVRSRTGLRSALGFVTAAVVGVIANLAVWFGAHVLFTHVDEARVGPLRILVPDPTTVDPISVAIAVAALVALTRSRWPMLAILGSGAAVGIAATAAGLR